jgi:hypothetical protein
MPLCLPAEAQSTFTVTKEGTTYVNDVSVGNVAFLNPANAALPDGNRAVATATLTLLGSFETNYLKVTNFGFALPTEAIITGVSVRVRKRATSVLSLLSDVKDSRVQLVVGGAVTSQNRATGTLWPNSDAEETYNFTLGSSGTPIDVTDVNSPDFGIAFSALYTGVAGAVERAEVNHIQMTVTYTMGLLPLMITSFSAASTSNSVILQWRIADPEDNAILTIERSHYGARWQGIHQQTLHVNGEGQTNRFEDRQVDAGLYYYRLRVNAMGGQSNYSSTRVVSVRSEHAKLTVYPNPVQHTLTIMLQEATEKVCATVRNTFGAVVLSSEIAMRGKRTLELPLATLRTGVYYLNLHTEKGTQTVRFVKE